MPLRVERLRRFLRICKVFRRVERRRVERRLVFLRICKALRRVRRFVVRRFLRRGLMIKAPVVRIGFRRVRRVFRRLAMRTLLLL